jgi:23S rRNA pseudouridine1911/1915/1917 synthase
MSARFLARRSASLAAVLREMGLDPERARQALADGRVFIGRMRQSRLDAPVEAGSEVRVHDPRDEVRLPEPFVLQHDRGVLVVDKPAGLPSVPDTVGAQGSLIDRAARAIGRPRDDLHPTSRLDRDVSGVVSFALDPRAAAALAAAREEGRYLRRYVAIACVGPGDARAAAELPDVARWTWSIDRARDPRLRRAAETGKPSATRVRVVAQARVGRARFALLALAPETGRTHQIRVHAAAAGAPLVGDRDYGGPTRLTTATGKVLPLGRIALHCARVEVRAPGTNAACIVEATSPVPRELVELAANLGLGGFEEAIACAL